MTKSVPGAAGTRRAVTSGLYVPQVPKIPKLDFRVEGVYTDRPGLPLAFQHGFFYKMIATSADTRTTANLIGSWIGRQGQGGNAWATYWFTPKDSLPINFRHEKVSKEFIPNGGTITDAGTRVSVWLSSTLSVSASLQYETWDFPVIASSRRTSVHVGWIDLLAMAASCGSYHDDELTVEVVERADSFCSSLLDVG